MLSSISNLSHSKGLTEAEPATFLAELARLNFGITAFHPAGCDANGEPRENLWPPPEHSAVPPSEGKNPLLKLLMNVNESQETLLEDYLFLTNEVNIHRCSDYCPRPPRNKKYSSEKICRMKFGTLAEPGKCLRSDHAIIKDKNGCLRLEMERDHPLLVQHSRIHTQGWRANGDIYQYR